MGGLGRPFLCRRWRVQVLVFRLVPAAAHHSPNAWGTHEAILQLTWDRVDLEQGIVDFLLPDEAETAKRRIRGPVSDMLVAMLRRYRKSQLDNAKRLPIYQAAQRELLLNPVQIPLVAIKKYQVVRKRVQNMYVAFSDFNTGLRNVWLNG